MAIDLKTLLKYSDFFTLLTEKCADQKCGQLIEMLEVVELQPGDILFSQGDSSDGLYILAEGLLGAEVTTYGSKKFIGTIRSGQTVGEMGVIAEQPRASTVKALRHSNLLKLTKDIFDLYFITQPKVLMKLLNILVARSANTLRSLGNVFAYSNVAFIPANDQVNMEQFFNDQMKTLQKNKKIKCFSTDDYSEIDDNLIQLIKDAEINSDYVIYKINPAHEKVADFFLSHVERAFIVADGTMSVSCSDFVLELHKNFIKHELVLLYPSRMQTKYIRAWLKKIDFFRYHHIALDNAEDSARLARFITGTALGLVLSGGGTKGWVHAGALKALEEANVPIDFIGGTSIGAVIGAKYLLENNYERFYEGMVEYAQMNQHPYRLRNLTFPMVSILNGKKLTKATRDLFRHARIENLWKPFFSICCNLNESLQKINEKGSLSLWLRAGCAIPGIVPPVTVCGKIYVDGAIVNNLPTDVMKEFFEGRGNIIAINLTYTHDDNKYSFPPVITFLEAILIKLKIRYNKYKMPKIHDLMMRARVIGTAERIQENSGLANILLRPNLGNYGMLTEIKHTQELFNMGYKMMQEKIPEIQKLINK